MAFVNLQNVTYKYPLTKTPVLQNINLQISEGEFVAIVGPNGAGKSTLCYTLAGFVPHFFKGEISGSVEVEERAIAIEARGFTSKKVKTSLHDIPDSRLDQVIRWGLVILVIISIVANIWPS